MMRFSDLAFFLFVFQVSLQAQESWQKLSQPAFEEVISEFRNPPSEYGPNLLWGWNGPIDEESVCRDLDRIASLGFRAVSIEAGYRMKEEYLSEGWFRLIAYAVEQSKLRGIKVWLIDEGKYPSGFAGGKFSRERPDLKMQGLEVAERIEINGGEHISRYLGPEIISAAAYCAKDNSVIIPDVSSGNLEWTAPEGRWKVILVKHRFRTSVTRAANNPTGGKDTANSLCDYLNPEATRQFIAFTHEEYKKYVGDEFGKTVLGFRGDEPDYGFIPWTPLLPSEFRAKKGYDIQPYLASFFTPIPDEEMLRAKADFWDVWSEMFAENFFRVQAEWCAANNLEYIVHLNHEDKMMQLVRSGGDFYRNMKYVQIPGVDAIWNQVWPGTVADFPKLASSVSHVYGKPRAFSESFAAYRTRPTVSTGKWVIDYQLVRGINLFEIMFFGSSADGNRELRGWMASDTFPDLMRYTNRLSWLLSQGRPVAEIAVYLPTASMWMGDRDPDSITWYLADQLLRNQRDFDFVGEYELAEGMELSGGVFRNKSGQSYSTVFIPSASAVSLQTLERIREFGDSGGKVIIFGRHPVLAFDSSFMAAGDSSGIKKFLGSSLHEPGATLTPMVKKALPEPDVKTSTPVPGLKYQHRVLMDGDLYFFFNESDERIDCLVKLKGEGKMLIFDAWDGSTREEKNIECAKGETRYSLDLDTWETKAVFIKWNATGK